MKDYSGCSTRLLTFLEHKIFLPKDGFHSVDILDSSINIAIAMQRLFKHKLLLLQFINNSSSTLVFSCILVMQYTVTLIVLSVNPNKMVANGPIWYYLTESIVYPISSEPSTEPSDKHRKVAKLVLSF